jgi:hypothetical protein
MQGLPTPPVRTKDDDSVRPSAVHNAQRDLAYVPAPEENAAAVMSLMREVRRIGIARFLFGSDFNVLSPSQEIENLVRLGLTTDEENSLRRNCAPWVCQESTAARLAI